MPLSFPKSESKKNNHQLNVSGEILLEKIHFAILISTQEMGMNYFSSLNFKSMFLNQNVKTK